MLMFFVRESGLVGLVGLVGFLSGVEIRISEISGISLLLSGNGFATMRLLDIMHILFVLSCMGTHICRAFIAQCNA